MTILDVGSVLFDLKGGISECIEKGKYAEAAQLAASYGSIMAALGEKQLERLLRT